MSIYKGDNLIAGSGLNIDLIPDPIPTEGSPRHVMSGGVYDALLLKKMPLTKLLLSMQVLQMTSILQQKQCMMLLGPVNLSILNMRVI